MAKDHSTIHTILLPGVKGEEIEPVGMELRRDAIYDDQGYVGEVVYVADTATGKVQYGWRPANKASDLTSRVEAVRRLPKFTNQEA